MDDPHRQLSMPMRELSFMHPEEISRPAPYIQISESRKLRFRQRQLYYLTTQEQ